jgi:hypothetical protein
MQFLYHHYMIQVCLYALPILQHYTVIKYIKMRYMSAHVQFNRLVLF